MKTSILKRLALVCLMAGAVTAANAQFGYYNEALLFSRNQSFGTARIMGIGGAQVALGGDAGVVAVNPAGLGFFNRSTLTFSPSFDFHNSTSDFFGNETTAFRNRFLVPEVGLVIHSGSGDVLPDDYKGGAFSISFQRTNNFNNDIQYIGRNGNSSVVNSFIASSGDLFPDELGAFEGIAYDHFLIDEADYDTSDPFFFDQVDGNRYISPNIADGTIEGYESVLGNYYGSLPEQTERIRTSGGQHVFNAAWGGNFKDVFYFGAGIGMHLISYDRERSYTERNFQLPNGDPDPLINEISIRDRLSIEGSGVSASLGAIVRPLPFLTLGASYQTPTFYALNEESDFRFTTDWGPNVFYAFNGDTTELGFISTESDIFISDYTLRTPSRVNLGGALFLGKSGFISGEVELMDFGASQLRSNDFETFEDNDVIREVYQTVINYKVGAELRLDQIRLRGGFNYQEDPFANPTVDRSIITYSGGIGYRNQDFFIDFAARMIQTSQDYSPYFLPENYAGGSPTVNSNLETVSAMVTIGSNF